MKITPNTANLNPREKTPGPHGKSVELSSIPRRTVVVLHENRFSQRFAKVGGSANRATRRAYARARGVIVPRPIYTPYEKPLAGTPAFEAQAKLLARGAVAVLR